MDAIAVCPLAAYAQQIPVIAGWFYKKYLSRRQLEEAPPNCTI